MQFNVGGFTGQKGEEIMRLIDADELKRCAIPCEIHNGALTDLCVPLYQIDNAQTIEPLIDYSTNEQLYRLIISGGQENTRLQAECKTCRYRDPEDKKCDCGGMERQGCIFPVSDDYCCKYYESNQNNFVSSSIEVVKVGEPLPNSDEINKAMERGKLYKRGYKDALDKAFSEFDANCTYTGDRVLQILEKLKEVVQNDN